MADPTQGLTPATPTASPLMDQAQTALSNPMGQATPSAGDMGSLMKHPIVKQIIDALAGGASAYGWTGSSPSERLQRTELNQNKADTLARLAQTGAYQQGELENRANLTNVAKQNADTRSANEKRMADMDEFTRGLKTQDEARKKAADESKAFLGQGRLDLATQKDAESVQNFERNYQLAKSKFGDEQARTMMIEQGLGIRQQLANTLQTALAQKGTDQGVAALQTFAKMRAESPLTMGILDSIGMGLPDVGSLVNKAQGMGIPGTAPNPAAPAQTAPAPQAPLAGQPSIPMNKVQAKQQQKKGAAPSADPNDPAGILKFINKP